MPSVEIILKYVDPLGNVSYRTGKTDENGCFEDFFVSVTGGTWKVSGEYPGGECEAPEVMRKQTAFQSPARMLMLMPFRKAIGRKVLEIYRRSKQKSFNASLNHCLSTVRSMLRRSKYCFLITNSDRQWPSARMVQPIVDFDTFVVWLGTNPTLRKIGEIEKDPNVTLAFGDDREDANLVIYGKASIIREARERRKHWITSWLLFFPGGPKGDDFVSIRVEPSEMELMNFKKSIVPEPFGLKPVKIIKTNESWQIQ